MDDKKLDDVSNGLLNLLAKAMDDLGKLRADLVSQPAKVDNKCESCEGYGRTQCLPDSDHTHPCDDCHPEALKEFMKGVAFAESDEYAAEKSPPPIATPGAARAALEAMDKMDPHNHWGVQAAEILDDHFDTFRTLLQQAAHDKGDGGAQEKNKPKMPLPPALRFGGAWGNIFPVGSSRWKKCMIEHYGPDYADKVTWEGKAE